MRGGEERGVDARGLGNGHHGKEIRDARGLLTRTKLG